MAWKDIFKRIFSIETTWFWLDKRIAAFYIFVLNDNTLNPDEVWPMTSNHGYLGLPIHSRNTKLTMSEVNEYSHQAIKAIICVGAQSEKQNNFPKPHCPYGCHGLNANIAIKYACNNKEMLLPCFPNTESFWMHFPYVCCRNSFWSSGNCDGFFFFFQVIFKLYLRFQHGFANRNSMRLTKCIFIYALLIFWFSSCAWNL